MAKRGNGDGNGVHAPWRDETSTPIFGGTRVNESSEPKRGKTGNNIEDRNHNHSMEREAMTIVRTVTERDNTVADSTANVPIDANDFNNTVSKNI